MLVARVTVAAVAACLLAALAAPSRAALSFTVDPNGWPNAAHRNAAVSAIQSTVNRYNAYGDFGNYNVWVYYHAGIPTAQASYLGSIGFGGTYPNERVMMHELAHYLGSGTYGDPWDGARGEALIDQFDGIEASLNGDANHFWPYGLNYDSEGAEINKQRQVALVYAQRADMGVGSTANPWSATNVQLTASDPLGESGFNYAARWSDSRFAHPGAAYSTKSFLMRTPEGGNSFTFVGDSLRINNTNGIAGGLLYKGTGSTGVITFKNLIVDGGYVRHASGSGDLFQVAGQVTLAGNATIDAAQGPITMRASVGGSGSLTKAGSHALTLMGSATYAGNTVISGGTLRLAAVNPVGGYTFDAVSGSTVVNGGTGGAAMNGTLSGGAAIVAGGVSGTAAVSLAGGASVNINSPIIDMSPNGQWTVSAWVKTGTPGASLLTKGDGSGWSNGNTIFYLGDGTAGGSGGVPSAVRYAGGFFQGSPAATSVANNAWRLVTYVNNGGSYAIYVDGVSQPLAPGNASFGNADVGAVVRLGVSTNTVAADGTLNFNGLMDDVQFYSHALSPQQVAALSQGGGAFGSLPSTTNVTIASGSTLDLGGAVQQIGSLTGAVGSNVLLRNGRLIVSSPVSTLYGGAMSGSGGLTKQGAGTLTLSGSLSYAGTTLVAGGALAINGSLPGAVAVESTATLQGGGTIFGQTTVAAGGTLAPGSSAGALTLGSLTLSPGALTQIEIGGPTRGAQYDAVLVNGAATLDGALAVSLLDGFAPAAGQTFDILDATSFSGAFASVELPELAPHLAWDVSQLDATGLLRVLYAGDFNRDGSVDGADLLVWQRGASPAPHGPDDLAAWTQNFGLVAEAPAAGVPEPTALALGGLAVVMFGGRCCPRGRN